MKIFVIIVLVVAAALSVYFFGSSRQDSVEPTPVPSSSPVSLEDLIYLEQPDSAGLKAVKSPLVISGKARGYWYFEASFPVQVLDGSGKLLLSHYAEAQSEWMTEDLVPFKATLNFPKPTTKDGILVLQKDNPSGLPEHDRELRIPISFDLDNWDDTAAVPGKGGECRATGCSGQICADQDVVTTCEYKEEYGCFKTAKCERQEDGQCGWTPSEELLVCLQSAWGVSGPQ